ncbi:MAG TPA: MBL fold metallo-hydrolase [Acidimicrobiales bacterium]|nr:MBL fold metallo-hydrolase [Acidimicrobiales bacterium]
MAQRTEDSEPLRGDDTVATRRWEVGSAIVTSVVEHQFDRIPPEFFFPDATTEAVGRHRWLVPDYADATGAISLRVQAFVIEVPGLAAVVDPCVGNGKVRALPFWHDQNWPFLERLASAGFSPDEIDLVIHTHLHADHVGWDTRRDGDAWVPTFGRARHLYTAADLEFARTSGMEGEDVFGDSIAPIIEAGLADVVAPDADLGHGLVLEPSPGHTPGHVSLWVESDGARALITGDFLHHPVQFAEPDWAEIADADVGLARETRHRMMARAAETKALVLGTHFACRPAGRVVADGDRWRFEPV